MGSYQQGIIEELLRDYQVEYVPGGSEQNCVRVIQSIVGVPQATTFLGCIGKDEHGQILQSAMKESGVNAIYKLSDEPTGFSCVCITGVHRSLVTKLGAADSSVFDILKEPTTWKFVEQAKYFYVEAYSLASRFKEMMELAKYAVKNDKFFVMNLSSPYLCGKFKSKMLTILPYVDLLFGSEHEALAFSFVNSLHTNDIEEIAMVLAKKKKVNSRRRVVVVTKSQQPVVSVHEGQVRLFPVIPTALEDIKTTVGAGDSFAGGYLSALITGGDHEQCMHTAIEAANYAIRHVKS